MQPFDGDVYDKRYEDVFAPAINEAGLEPYRVDLDPSVSVPINEIESGIRNAAICFAEITTNNPNVWFELGYAISASKDVVLVCSEERETHFPFDVQHRTIIKYRAGAPQDFNELQEKITERITALLKKQEEMDREFAGQQREKRIGDELTFFSGRWRVGHGRGMPGTFVMTLNANRSATKNNMPDASGTWEPVDGEAHIAWSDGWKDILRCTPDGVLKLAFGPGVTFAATPTNRSIAQKMQ